MNEPVVQPGDKVRFWTQETGLVPQMGTVHTLHAPVQGIPYAEIKPDSDPERHIYLCHRAVWGYEWIDEWDWIARELEATGTSRQAPIP